MPRVRSPAHDASNTRNVRSNIYNGVMSNPDQSSRQDALTAAAADHYQGSLVDWPSVSSDDLRNIPHCSGSGGDGFVEEAFTRQSSAQTSLPMANHEWLDS
jgi:hypothetical protein